MDTERLKKRVKRSDVLPVLVVALVVLSSTVALAADTTSRAGDFEEYAVGTTGPGNWTGFNVSNKSLNGNRSLLVEDNADESLQNSSVNTTDFNTTVLIRADTFRTSTEIRAVDSNGNGVEFQFDTADGIAIREDGGKGGEANSSWTPTGGEWYYVEGRGNGTEYQMRVWQANQNRTDAENLTLATDRVTTAEYEFGSLGDGYKSWVDSYAVTSYSESATVGGGGGSNAEVNESLEIDTRHYLNHNTTTPFRVYYTKNNTTTINVTSNATVSVRDPEVVSVDQQAGSMTSTNNTSINQITFVNASYEGANASKEVVVANETVENIDILPPLQKWTATFGDDNSLVVVIATAIAAGVALVASSIAGVAAFPVIVTGAWVAGYVATHTLLAAILMSIFVGLNVAQVVEYSGS